MAENQKEKFKQLKEQKLHGHSFLNMENNPNSNMLIGNYSNGVSDAFIKFMVQARTNNCYTGQIYAKHKNVNNTNEGPRCPYCNKCGKEYTLEHILNGCKNNLTQQTRRHNMICTEIINTIRNKYRGANIIENSEIKINGRTIRVGEAHLKPDIIVYRTNRIDIIEVNCPYDCYHENDECTTLEKAYKYKINKYASLVDECKRYIRKVNFVSYIVSSLGVVYNESMKDLRRVLNHDDNQTKITIRRTSIAAIIGSYFIFNKLNPRRRYQIEEDATGNPEAEEPTDQE